ARLLKQKGLPQAAHPPVCCRGDPVDAYRQSRSGHQCYAILPNLPLPSSSTCLRLDTPPELEPKYSRPLPPSSSRSPASGGSVEETARLLHRCRCRCCKDCLIGARATLQC